jgi:glycosyltransferase involved in cell wall biosynthesis
MGRINQDKGVHTACRLARDTNNSLVISGYFDSSDMQKKKYFENKVKPYIDIELDITNEEAESYEVILLKTIKENPGKTIYVGRSNICQRNVLYKNAKAYLFTSGMENEWIEPFGLVIIEANASGTPVVAFNNGAVNEIIIKNTNGIIENSYDGLSNSINDIGGIDPHICRKHVESLFTSDIMAKNYINLYNEIIKRSNKERK